MISAKERLETLKKQRQDKLDGKLQLIPFYHHFPKLSTFIPGIFKGAMITCLASTGAGKSKFSRYCTLLIPYWLKQKENLKYKIIYFALEESEEEFVDYIFLMLLNINYGIEIDYAELNSYRQKAISNDVLDKMATCSEEVDAILKDVVIVTDTYNPTGMYKKCMEMAGEWGSMVDGVYTPTDSNLQVVVVVDHISLIAGEKDNEANRYLTQGQAMSKWSTHYCLKYITKRLNWAVWNVQQTTMTSEGHEQKKTNTLEPSEADAGDNKIILRDSKLILTLFSPFKHKIANYRDFNIPKLQDGFRNLGIIKNRYGTPNVNIPLYFNGAAGLYEELSLDKQQQYYVKK